MDRIFRDEAHQEEFERQGFTIVRLLSEPAATALLERIEEARKTALPGHSDSTIDQSFCTPDAEYRRRVDALGSEAIREPLLSLLVGYRLAACGVMIKKPRSGPMLIHRDRTILADLDLAPVNAWCPLVDVDDSHGNLAMLPGSHKLPNVETEGVEPFYANYGEALKELCVSYRLAAGEAILFDHRLLHWSRPNQHDEPRPVLRATTVPAESRLVFFKLDSASGGKRFEILDAEADGAIAHSPDEMALGTIPAATLGFADNNNREITLRECRERAAQASGTAPLAFALQRAKSAVREFRARLSA